jgi:hypothetical protein
MNFFEMLPDIFFNFIWEHLLWWRIVELITTSKQKHHTLSTVFSFLFIISATTLHTWKQSPSTAVSDCTRSR